MAEALDKMGADQDRIVPIFITIDPERDTPAVLKKYLAAFGPHFVGLTGTPQQIEEVEKEYPRLCQEAAHGRAATMAWTIPASCI